MICNLPERNLAVLSSHRLGLAFLACVVALSLSSASAQESKPASELNGLPLLFSENFESAEALGKFEFSDPSAWQIGEQNGNHFLSQFKASVVKTPVRSPFNRS